MPADIRLLIISDAKKPPERLCGAICPLNSFSSLKEKIPSKKCIEEYLPNYYHSLPCEWVVVGIESIVVVMMTGIA